MSDASGTVQDNPRQSRYEIAVEGEPAGFVAYDERDGVYGLTHTEIDPRFEGRGVGSQLVRGALDDLRARGAAVLPFCTFVRGYIEKHPEYLDLVPAERRDRFDLPA